MAASYSHTQVQSVVDSVRVAESMRAKADGRPLDAMAALEAEANAAMSSDAAAGAGVYGCWCLLMLQEGQVWKGVGACYVCAACHVQRPMPR